MRSAVLAVTLLFAASEVAAQQLSYPPPPQAEIHDDYFGRRVADPYRSLEEPDAPATKQWIEAENTLTHGYLGKLERRDSIRQLLTSLWNYPRVEVPVREAGQLWYRRNTGLQKQSVLFRKTKLDVPAAPVLDPNALSPDGSIAVGQWTVSPDGRLLAYTTSRGGADLRDIHIRDLVLGDDLPDVVANVKFSEIAWTRDSKGFYYSRFRSSERQANLQDANRQHTLYYHALGEGADPLIFRRTDDSTASASATVSDDGCWLYISSSSGTNNNRLWVADLADPAKPNIAATPLPVTTAEDAFYRPLAVVDKTLYLHTNWQAPRGRVVAAAVGDSARAHWRTVLHEASNVIDKALIVGDRIVVVYQVDVQSRVRLFDLAGAPQSDVSLPDVGTASGLNGRNDGSDFFFSFSSYLRPPGVYRFDLRSGQLEEFELSTTAFDASRYETRFAFYESKDGTRVPLFIMARKGIALDGSHPTMLYGYGGFDISLRPSYSASVAAWLELGGVYAVANLRGGGEYGEAWHRAGMRGNKQNVFDDFMAAAEFLIHEGYTTPSSLAISGGSNGGLLVGAAMAQRPDLFGVALPAAGVLDMMRYQRFTGGQFWADEYGSASDSSAVRYLLAYSPLHNLKAGTCYPATLVTVADHDDRVVPGHSYKYAATLQKAQGCSRPTLIRVETLGSHGFRTTEHIIAEVADRYTFALANLVSRPLGDAAP
jgi:prolyl oligopeptidase